ncbi:MAG: DUF1349 domain-containing protein [Oscillospiraceae bacterium]|nr:DUF1349 domain-containing protein [Oscillospiraceae bacterium]
MDITKFHWLNESRLTVDGEAFSIYAPPKSEYFNNPVPVNGEFIPPIVDAPVLYTEIEGDFVMRVRVKPNFLTNYDAACLMVIKDENVWFKGAFEKSDFGTTAVVTVVTNGLSDDANGCNIEGDTVWLQMARVGNNFAVHYSLDGEKFDMVRLCWLPVDATVKAGVEAQSPTGEGGEREFCCLTVEKKTVKDLRAGK